MQTTFIAAGHQPAADHILEGVMNGPLKFLTARKILPLLDLLAQNLIKCSLGRAPKSFAVARMLAFLSVSVLLEILWILLWIKVIVILCGV